MGIRETLNKNPAITTGATIAIIVIALVVIVMQMRPSHPKIYTGNQEFFTDNDGETWFAADRTNIPPFIDKDGLTAVRCYVYKCGKTKFVGYLEKFTDEAKKKMAASANNTMMPGMPNPMMNTGRLMKKKGDKDWVSFEPNNPEAGKKIGEIIQVKCPDGSTDVTPVYPGD